MKTILSFITIISLFFVSCEKTENDKLFSPGEGFEIYLTTVPYSHNLNMDYGTIDFDTITLSDTPMLYYNDLLKYDTITHKLTLGISHDSLKIGETGVFGRMFVVTIDKEPVYCGFKWTVISSVPCNWVFIEEPFADLDNLNDNEIRISFFSPIYKDPRLDKRIADRLKSDGKIK